MHRETNNGIDQLVLESGQAWEFSSVQAAFFFCEDELLRIAISKGVVTPENEL